MSTAVRSRGRTFELADDDVWSLIGRVVDGVINEWGESEETVIEWCQERMDARSTPDPVRSWAVAVDRVIEGFAVDPVALRVICEVLDLDAAAFPFAAVIPPEPEPGTVRERFQVETVEEFEDALDALSDFASDRHDTPVGEPVDRRISNLIYAALRLSMRRHEGGDDA